VQPCHAFALSGLRARLTIDSQSLSRHNFPLMKQADPKFGALN
jgi:hypothetical protein